MVGPSRGGLPLRINGFEARLLIVPLQVVSSRCRGKCMVKGNAHIHVCYLVCSPLDIVFSVLEVEVHQKKGNRGSSIVTAYCMLTLVSNRDFAIMIARMGFAHVRSIA